MLWLWRAVSSSIGRKLLMALSGLSFCAFLVVHLFGNFFLYVGRESFNSYVEHLHSLGVLVNLAEAGLIGLAGLHIGCGLWLFVENLAARPVRYAVDKSSGGRTLASRIMPYTGLYLAFFVLIHLVGFKLGGDPAITVYDKVNLYFDSFPAMLFYTLSVVVAAFHVSHGFWSAFQTLGLNHPKYMPGIEKLGLALALVIGVGFGLIPLYMLIV